MSIDRDAKEYTEIAVKRESVRTGFEFSGKNLNEPHKEFHNILSQAFIAALIIGGIRYVLPSTMSDVAAYVLWLGIVAYGVLALITQHMRGAVAHRVEIEYRLFAIHKEISRGVHFARKTALNTDSDSRIAAQFRDMA